MKIKSSTNKSKRIILIVSGVILFGLLGWLYYTHHYQKWPFLPTNVTTSPTGTVNYEPPSDSQAKTGTTIKERVAEQTKSDSTSATSATGGANIIVMDITSVNKTSDTLMVRSMIQKTTSTGTCTLTAVGSNGATYTASVGVQANASTSTCQGFNIPINSLSPGTWKIIINFKDGSDTATATKEVFI